MREPLLALLVFTGMYPLLPAGSAAAQSATEAAPVLVPGTRLSLQAVDYPGRSLREEDGALVVAPNSDDSDKIEVAFKVIAGLTGTGAVTIESSKHPGTYWRHTASGINFEASDGSDLFKADASFYARPGLSAGSDVSFESVNTPGSFVRDSYFRGVLAAKVDSAVFANAASFMIQRPQEANVVIMPPQAGGFIAASFISCAPWTPKCTGTVALGTALTFVAQAFDRFGFTAWGGDCAGQSTSTCVLKADHDLHVEASFTAVATPTQILIAKPPEHGRISTEYFSCDHTGSDCQAVVQAGSLASCSRSLMPATSLTSGAKIAPVKNKTSAV